MLVCLGGGGNSPRVRATDHPFLRTKHPDTSKLMITMQPITHVDLKCILLKASFDLRWSVATEKPRVPGYQPSDIEKHRHQSQLQYGTGKTVGIVLKERLDYIVIQSGTGVITKVFRLTIQQ